MTDHVNRAVPSAVARAKKTIGWLRMVDPLRCCDRGLIANREATATLSENQPASTPVYWRGRQPAGIAGGAISAAFTDEFTSDLEQLGHTGRTCYHRGID